MGNKNTLQKIQHNDSILKLTNEHYGFSDKYFGIMSLNVDIDDLCINEIRSNQYLPVVIPRNLHNEIVFKQFTSAKFANISVATSQTEPSKYKITKYNGTIQYIPMNALSEPLLTVDTDYFKLDSTFYKRFTMSKHFNVSLKLNDAIKLNSENVINKFNEGHTKIDINPPANDINLRILEPVHMKKILFAIIEELDDFEIILKPVLTICENHISILYVVLDIKIHEIYTNSYIDGEINKSMCHSPVAVNAQPLNNYTSINQMNTYTSTNQMSTSEEIFNTDSIATAINVRSHEIAFV